MKSLIKFFSMAALVAMFATSCDTDPCKDVVCGDFGTCDEGLCVCDTGYEQDTDGLCNTEIRAKFIGSWTVSDSCSSSGSASYTVQTNNSSSDILTITITNFWDVFSNQVTATVSGNSVTIPRQEPDNDDFFVEGSGTLSSDGTTIDFSYTISDETVPAAITTDNCDASWVKN